MRLSEDGSGTQLLANDNAPKGSTTHRYWRSVVNVQFQYNPCKGSTV